MKLLSKLSAFLLVLPVTALANGTHEESMMDSGMFRAMQEMMGGGSITSLGVLETITWLVWLAVGVLLIVWLWKQITKK